MSMFSGTAGLHVLLLCHFQAESPAEKAFRCCWQMEPAPWSLCARGLLKRCTAFCIAKQIKSYPAAGEIFRTLEEGEEEFNRVLLLRTMMGLYAMLGAKVLYKQGMPFKVAFGVDLKVYSLLLLSQWQPSIMIARAFTLLCDSPVRFNRRNLTLLLCTASTSNSWLGRC